MKKEILCGLIASQPSAVTLNCEQMGVVVFVLIEVAGKYHKFYYKGSIPDNMFSSILVSSVGDNVRIEVRLSYYSGAREIINFVNCTRDLG